jgi:RimJ/RimL family protein N-acetyltransferase
VTDIRTSRLQLHAVDADEARRIVARSAGPTDAWAEDYPFEGDVGAVGSYLHAHDALGDQRPFGYYRITRLSDGRAIGGVGFKGQPRDGRVEIGYGLAPSARGHGYAAEAVTALLDLAAARGVGTVTANTAVGNAASRRTLIRSGFHLVTSDAGSHYFEANL